MIAYSRGGPIPFTTLTFPDGQPHVALQVGKDEWDEATIESAIRSPKELLDVLLLKDCLSGVGYSRVNLDIRYLMGARMDRRINSKSPATLEIVTKTINMSGFYKVRVLDVHSRIALLILNAVNVFPMEALCKILLTTSHTIVIPDKGAKPRVEAILNMLAGGDSYPSIQASKERDPVTGRLAGFKVESPSRISQYGKYLIIDDICDGGGTFEGLAHVLRQFGATKIDLFVTHGIFSKGTNLKGIDTIYTTNSYQDGFEGTGNLVVFPVSMKEMT